jgi:TolB protein
MSSSASRTGRSAWIFSALAAALLLAASPLAAAEVWLDVAKSGTKRILLALSPGAPGEAAEETTLRRTLENDLLMAGYFQLAPLDAAARALAEGDRAAAAPRYEEWGARGVELLLRVDATRAGGKLAAAYALHDVGARAALLAREERDAPGEAVAIAHRIADAVMRALTGAPGLALTRIACTWSRDGAPKRVVVMDYDGRNLHPVSPEKVLALSPAWFPDGGRLAYVTYRQGRPEVVAHNLTSGQVRSLSFFPGLNAFPAVSPDGKRLLLTLSRDGNPEVYRMAVDGSELKRLTFTPAVEASPCWSPDETQIALVSDQGGGPQVNLLGASGGRMRRVSFVGNYATSPDWSPRGDRIVFTALVEGTFQLFLLDPATGNQEQVTFDHEHKESPSWAPDGRHVVYSQGRGNTYRLYILDVPTGERTLVTKEKGSFTSPAWSP